jgi:3-oxoacyl-(acyl-carrier-protein) synthase
LVGCCGVDLVVYAVGPAVCSGHCAAAAGALEAVVVVLSGVSSVIYEMDGWMDG